jgi:hypothetical protein
MSCIIGMKDMDTQTKELFCGKIMFLVNKKEREINEKIYITFGSYDVHLYLRKNGKSQIVGLVKYNGNFYSSKKNLKENKIEYNILH